MFMQIAEIVAQRSTCERAQVGAIAVLDNRVVSIGYGGAPSGMPHCTEVGCKIGPDGGCIRTIHAEVNVIAFAARNGVALNGAELYVTMSPCYNCAKLLINTGIKGVFYNEEYRRKEGINLLKRAGMEIKHLK